MRALFVPHPMPSHFLPLVALDRMLADRPGVRTSFLLPAALHTLARSLGVEVLDIDRDFGRSFLAPELRAYRSFSPDVVVDDFSYTTGLATRYRGLPRVAVVRKGVFPGESPHDPRHRHSGGLEWLLETWPLEALGVPRPTEASELFEGDVKIVPSIPSVEPLPEALGENPSYVFSGPLLVDAAKLLENLSSLDPALLREVRTGWDAGRNDFLTVDRVESFLDRHRGTGPVVYLTLGMARHSDLSPVLSSCVDLLLDRGAVVVTNARVEAPADTARSERLLFSAFLPMDLVCSECDLMIHQCGSGTYGYQLRHRLPAITLGTMCYDRDEVARRLEELGTSIHVASPAEERGFSERFARAVDLMLDPGAPRAAEARAVASRLADEIAAVRARFDLQEVLTRAMESGRSP